MGDTMAVGVLKKVGGDVVCERCELADNPLKRMRGLLGRTELAENEGMLFRPAGSIHMYFMRFPIDVLFVGADGSVIKIVEQLGAWRMAASLHACITVELPTGSVQRHQVLTGDRLSLQSRQDSSALS